MTTESIFCTNCGSTNLPTNSVCTNCGKPLTQSVSPHNMQPAQIPSSGVQKPGKLQLVAILCLLDGAANLLWAMLAFIALFAGNFLACYQTPYCLVLGVLEIVYGMRLLSNPTKITSPAKYLAVMQLVGIITLNAFTFFVGSPVVGVLSLILYSADDVQAYFRIVQANTSKVNTR